MAITVEAVIDERGQVRLLSPVALPGARRAIVTILDEASAPAIERVGDATPSPWRTKYEPVRTIGQGGMSQVHLARDRQTGALVCVKELQADVRRSALQQECRALSRLTHPCILRLLNFETRGESPYLVMEYGKGVPLARLIATRLFAQEGLACLVAADLFDAVASAHEHEVIHRDLKPANILIEGFEGGLRPRILDFGLAIVDRLDDRDAMTGVGLVAGTLNYMAPEQLRGVAVSGACDVYAVGQICWEMCMGRQAFGGGIHDVATEKFARDGLDVEDPPLRVSEALTGLIAECTRVNAADRPAARAAADRIRALVPALPPQANRVPVNLSMSGPLGEQPEGWFDGLGVVERACLLYERVIVRDPETRALCMRLSRDAGPSDEFGVLMQRVPAVHLAGSTVRFEAHVRTDALAGWAGLWVRTDAGVRHTAFDNMHDRPIRGTTPWTAYAIELPVPEHTEWLNVGFLLAGAGAVFARDARLYARSRTGEWIPLGLPRGDDETIAASLDNEATT